MSVEKIKVRDVFSEMIAITKREKELFLLLGGFIASIGLIFNWAYYEVYARYIQVYFETGANYFTIITDMNAELAEGGTNILGSFFLFLIHLAIMAIWSRASILGTRQALAGGMGLLINRYGWVLWRFICGMGWMFLVSFIIIILFIFLPINPETLMGTSGDYQGVSPEIAFSPLFIIVTLIFLLPMFAVIFLTSISIHCESRDVRLPIHKSFKYMKGNFMRAASFLILLFIGSFVILFYGEIFVLKFYFSVSSWFSFVGVFAITMLSTLFTLLSYTYGALYASKLVPELRV